MPMLPSCLTDLRRVRERAIGEMPGNRTLVNASGFVGEEPNEDASHGFLSTFFLMVEWERRVGLDGGMEGSIGLAC